MEDFTFFGIDHQDLARTYPAFRDHLLGLVSVGPDLRSQGDKAVIGRHPTCGSQAIAIQQATGITTICQHDAGRPVPRLHVHGVVLIKRLQIGVDPFNVLPSRRDQHPQRSG